MNYRANNEKSKNFVKTVNHLVAFTEALDLQRLPFLIYSKNHLVIVWMVLLYVSVSAMLVYTVKKNIAQVFILERYFFVSICPAAGPGTCLAVF